MHRSRRSIRSAKPPPSTPLPPLPSVPSSAPHLGDLNLALDTARRFPHMYNTPTLESLERADPSAPGVPRRLDPGFPFNSADNGPEDLDMKDNFDE